MGAVSSDHEVSPPHPYPFPIIVVDFIVFPFALLQGLRPSHNPNGFRLIEAKCVRCDLCEIWDFQTSFRNVVSEGKRHTRTYSNRNFEALEVKDLLTAIGAIRYCHPSDVIARAF